MWLDVGIRALQTEVVTLLTATEDLYELRKNKQPIKIVPNFVYILMVYMNLVLLSTQDHFLWEKRNYTLIFSAKDASI